MILALATLKALGYRLTLIDDEPCEYHHEGVGPCTCNEPIGEHHDS
jgi:hypothetical protein